MFQESGIEEPEALLRRLRLGREEYCQRLLTMLVLGAAYPKWNSMNTPSPSGIKFLEGLHALAFPALAAATLDGCEFVDEFDLPARHEFEPGGSPDYAVIRDGALWMIELKTECASHRKGQLTGYVELARHHYPDCALSLTYLTPPIILPGLPDRPGLALRSRHLGSGSADRPGHLAGR